MECASKDQNLRLKENLKSSCQTVFLVLILLLSLTLVVEGQDRVTAKSTPRAVGYGFVSPNTREGLQLEEAIENLHSADEDELVQQSHELGCRLRAKLRVNKALGTWRDGSENSVMFSFASDESTMRYAAAVLGKTWQQKTVLYFRKQEDGPARMYLISVRRRRQRLNLEAQTLVKTLDKTGVSYRTLVPLKMRVVVYIVDLSNELQSQVQVVARRLHSRVISFSGTSAFIGDDKDPSLARSLFEKEMKAFEANHSLNNRCHQAGIRP